MAIPYVNARDIELAASSWPDGRFVSLCNALIWAYAGNSREAIRKSFTKRVNAKDLGVDALADLSDDALPLGPFLQPGCNVFQFKRRDFSFDKLKRLHELLRELDGAAAHVARRSGRPLRSYILFTNLDLIRSQTLALEAAIRKGWAGEPLHVVVNHAADLASMLADCPHIRAAFFATPRFETWEKAWDRIRRKTLAPVVGFVDRGRELEQLGRLLSDSSVRVILVSGPPEVGKGRLILEATKESSRDCVFVTHADDLERRALEELGSSKREVLVVVQGLTADLLPKWIPWVLADGRIKLVASIVSTDEARLPGYGFDHRVRTAPVEPLTREASFELLTQAAAPWDFSLREWVVRQAGGSPGVLLTAAALGTDLRTRASEFADAVGKGIAERIARDAGTEALAALRVLSLLSKTHDSELESLAEAWEMPAARLRGSLRGLIKLGVVEEHGRFYEVRPLLVARHLAAEALEEDPRRFKRLVAALERPACVRLIHRLAELHHSERIRQLRQDLFHGLFERTADLRRALAYLPSLAEALPEQTARYLEQALDSLVDQPMDSAVHQAIESLLSRASTSARAIRLLLQTRQHERFIECFAARHPQVAAGLDERLEVLRQTLRQGTAAEQMLAVKACQQAVSTAHVSLRYASGSQPFDPPGARTWGQVSDYSAEALDLLLEAGRLPARQVAVAARKLVAMVASRVFALRPAAALTALRACQNWLEDETSGLDPADVLPYLHEIKDEQVGVIARHIQALPGFRRIQLCIHEFTHHSDAALEELRRHASKVASDPSFLSDERLEWLSKHGLVFVLLLGEEDQQRVQARLLEQKACDSQATAFGTYCAGWAQVDPSGLGHYLNAVEARPVCPPAVLSAAKHLPRDPTARRLVQSLLERGQVSVESVVAEVAMEWMRALDPPDALALMRSVAGPAFQRADLACDLLGWWNHHDRPLAGDIAELAWQCLESGAHSERRQDAWHRDQLAARLTRNDPERGFRLLSRLCQDRQPAGWDPLSHLHRHAFWDALRAVDRGRALETAFLSNRLGCCGWLADEFFDQEADAEILAGIASRGPELAVRVAWALEREKPGFWPLAFKLLEAYGAEGDVADALADAAVQGPAVVLGSLFEYYRGRKEEVERVLADKQTPAYAKPWLRKVSAALQRDVGHEVVWDSRLEESDLKRLVDDKDSPERLWAIGRILKYAKWEDVQRLLKPEDIRDGLPLVDMPEPTKKALESAVEYWMRRG